MLKPAALATLPAAYAAQPAITLATPAEVRAARLAAGLDVDQAAKLVHVTTQTWVSYERPPRSASSRGIPTGLWELFQIKTNATPPASYHLVRPTFKRAS